MTAALLLAAASLVAVLVVQSTLANQIRIFTVQGGNPPLDLPPNTDLSRYYTSGLVDAELPQDLIDEIARNHIELVRHLVPKLHTPVNLGGRPFVLTGVGPEADPEAKPKPIAPAGHCLLGSQVARRTGLKSGDSVTLLGSAFIVDSILPEEGAFDDLRVFAPLADVQKLLGKPRIISMIEALPCKCTSDARFASEAQRQIQARLGDRAHVVLFLQIAKLRARTRVAVDDTGPLLVLVLGALAGLIIGVTLLANLRSRRPEFAILFALGFRPRAIVLMSAAKVTSLGLLGGLLGWLVGTVALDRLVPAWLDARPVYPSSLPLWSVLFATGLALAFSLPALLLAARTDPARMLNEDPT